MELELFKFYIKQTKNKMFRLALRILGSYEEAEEAVQEAYIKIWEKRNIIRDDKNLEGFFMIVLKNHCLDKFKSKHFKYKKSSLNDYKDFLEQRDVLPDKDAEFKNVRDIINEILQSFPEKWRLIIQLRDIEGYSNPEVAKILSLDENNVKVTLSRARKKIREILINQYNYNYHENR